MQKYKCSKSKNYIYSDFFKDNDEFAVEFKEVKFKYFNSDKDMFDLDIKFIKDKHDYNRCKWFWKKHFTWRLLEFFIPVWINNSKLQSWLYWCSATNFTDSIRANVLYGNKLEISGKRF